MKRRILVLSWLMFITLPIYGQNQGVITLDHTDGLWNIDTLNINQPITFHLRLENNTTDVLKGFTHGFEISSPDGAQWDTLTAAHTGAITMAMFDQLFVTEIDGDGMGADTIGLAGFVLFATGVLDGFNEIAFTVSIGPIDAAYHQDEICLDSAFFPPGGVWKWGLAAGESFPDWGGPYCFTVFDPNAPVVSNLVVSTDSLHFEALEGGSSPALQTFTISSDGVPLPFTLNENSDWLVPSPVQGTTDRTISVQINTIGLTSGLFLDSIVIESAEADNSPQQVMVSLEIIPPPPTINVNPAEFFFNAVAGGANPDDKILTITNSGGSTLDWTVTNSQPWLSLLPATGLDSGDVTLSVDITSLPFDTYFDTIVVSAIDATNDPVSVPVSLSVGSDLPVIEVDKPFNFVIVPMPSTSIDPETFLVLNGGAGIMNFWLEEDSPRLFTLDPESGTAPQEIEVGFKVQAGSAGNDYFDTIWVHSNEAINSPLPVVFQMHYTEDPAVLHVAPLSISLNVFECDMGAGMPMPSQMLSINNIGGDDPIGFVLEYESELFTVNIDSGPIPMLIQITANDLQLPLGSYLDTIVVIADRALSSPDTIIVSFNMIAGIQTPEIVLSTDMLFFTAQENSGPSHPQFMQILNRFGGCMEWEIQEAIGWLSPDVTTGDVPISVNVMVNSTGFPMAEYNETFQVLSSVAANSPQTVFVNLKVWRFHGDWDYNGLVDLLDLLAMVSWLYGGGTIGPEPEYLVGDVNCDYQISIEDVIWLVAYLFQNGPAPCGNPYKK